MVHEGHVWHHPPRKETTGKAAATALFTTEGEELVFSIIKKNQSVLYRYFWEHLGRILHVRIILKKTSSLVTFTVLFTNKGNSIRRNPQAPKWGG